MNFTSSKQNVKEYFLLGFLEEIIIGFFLEKKSKKWKICIFALPGAGSGEAEAAKSEKITS